MLQLGLIKKLFIMILMHVMDFQSCLNGQSMK
uniref:Uncharacterized protein n=1 Tax=CrAss-like virus sp. ctYsL76 TaxID=2826826 RepID=A0A8S5QNI5_9CAUD|nr:MAG TPA: hypothetical protein [CrAss-like virus sp. ctYsL76]